MEAPGLDFVAVPPGRLPKPLPSASPVDTCLLIFLRVLFRNLARSRSEPMCVQVGRDGNSSHPGPGRVHKSGFLCKGWEPRGHGHPGLCLRCLGTGSPKGRSAPFGPFFLLPPSPFFLSPSLLFSAGASALPLSNHFYSCTSGRHFCEIDETA